MGSVCVDRHPMVGRRGLVENFKHGIPHKIAGNYRYITSDPAVASTPERAGRR